MSGPPTREQLVGPGPVSLDERYVLKHFLGKTRQQLRKELPENGSCYAEDFMWMTVDGLRYYLPAVFDYIRDDQSYGDSDFCSGLLCSLCAQVGFGKLSADVLRLMR